MSFTFGMYYKPAYQKRYGTCESCKQGILAGSQVMIGTGFFHGHLIRKRHHYNCFIQAIQEKAKGWFFKNDYQPKAMAPEKKAELNRLRAKRHYIQQKGGDANEITVKVAVIEKQIALVKSG